jgi:hypothetical protein
MYYELLGRETSEVADVLLHLAGVLELQQDGATALSMYKVRFENDNCHFIMHNGIFWCT